MLCHSWTGDIHMCRALIITSIILSFFGSILVLVGMKCTKIGGTEISNARVTFAGGMNYFIGGKTFLFLNSEIQNTIDYFRINTPILFQGCALWLLSHITETKLGQNFKTLTTELRSMYTDTQQTHISPWISSYPNILQINNGQFLVFIYRFEIGVGVFVGWAGSTLLVVGGLIYSIFAGREGCQSR